MINSKLSVLPIILRVKAVFIPDILSFSKLLFIVQSAEVVV